MASSAAATKRSGRGLRRSFALLAAYRTEQSDPDRLYNLLATDSARELSRFAKLRDALLIDVGGGPGYFQAAFAGHGARYVLVDSQVPDTVDHVHRTIRGSGLALPLRSDSVDIAYSSNVIEHVAAPEVLADELVRITKPGGIAYLSYTLWLSPNGGHETGPWHLLLGGRRAAERFARRSGRRPKNDFGRTLFAVSARRMIAWAKRAESDGRLLIVDMLPRYHPWWAGFLVRIPLLREIAVWNLVIVVRPAG